MKRMIHLDEKIYDSELGDGVSSTQYIYKKYYNMPNTFMSFTAIDKLGINPTSRYDTPIGIYTYPIKEFFDRWVWSGEIDDRKYNSDHFKKHIGSFAPFAGGGKFVWVVQYKGPKEGLCDLGNYTKDQYANDVGLMETLTIRRFKDKNSIKNLFFGKSDGKASERMFQKYIEMREEEGFTIEGQEDMVELLADFLEDDLTPHFEMEAYVQTLAGQMWNISRVLSANPVNWNTNLRKMGYQCIADFKGEGIIHKAESIQAVFLSIKGMKILDKVQNIEATRYLSMKLKNVITKMGMDMRFGVLNILVGTDSQARNIRDGVRANEDLPLTSPVSTSAERIFNYVYPEDIFFDLENLNDYDNTGFYSNFRKIIWEVLPEVNKLIVIGDTNKELVNKLMSNLLLYMGTYGGDHNIGKQILNYVKKDWEIDLNNYLN